VTSCDGSAAGAPERPAAAADAPAAVSVGRLGTPTDVGPAADHPLAGVDRDAGISVRLRDGSVVWFFGDTAYVNPDWSLKYFVIGTAAWAAADAPTRTLDTVEADRPVTFAAPNATAMPCTPILPAAGVWPYSAVVVPDGDRDRVVVWMENICLGTSRDVESRGMAVGEWVYDPADPPVDRPVVVRQLNPALSLDRSYGYASVLAPDGSVYAYFCDRFPQVDDAGNQLAGPGCHVARVAVDDVDDPAAYEPLAGGEWGGPGRPDDIELPVGPGVERPEIARPPGGFSVSYHAGLRRYVMAYSPWPGMSEQMHVRFADAPEGPWSAPETIALPGCHNRTHEQDFYCYAASLQPFLDTDDELGVGWYDRLRSDDAVSGTYRVATVPVGVTR